MMTPGENLLSTLRRRGFESVPVDLNLCPSQEENFKRVTGKTDYREYFGLQFRSNWMPLKARSVNWREIYSEKLPEQTDFDAWGVGHSHGSAEAFHMTRMHHPLKGERSAADIRNYPFPDFDPKNTAELKRWADDIHAQGLAAVGGMECTIWETAWYIRGMEELMVDMLSEDPIVELLLDRITEIACTRAASYAEAGCDILQFGDDIGMQKTPMMKAETWERWLKPRLARVIGSAKKTKSDIVINYHSCGHVIPFLDGLIEAGIEVLNPVQPESMDFAEVYRRTGTRLSYWGTIGTQTTLPFGKPADVKAAVERNLRICGKKGGIVIGPTHLVEPEVPWDNIIAMVETVKNFRL